MYLKLRVLGQACPILKKRNIFFSHKSNCLILASSNQNIETAFKNHFIIPLIQMRITAISNTYQGLQELKSHPLCLAYAINNFWIVRLN